MNSELKNDNRVEHMHQSSKKSIESPSEDLDFNESTIKASECPFEPCQSTELTKDKILVEDTEWGEQASSSAE